MLSFSTKSKYGLKAVLFLAEFYDRGLVSTKEIATRQDIPRQYLEQIFNQLGKAGIVKSVRGKHGGYTLARTPEKIIASEIITLLEGGIELASPSYDPTDVVNDLLHKAEKSLIEVFNMSLADLAAEQQSRRNIPSYTI